MADNKYKGLTVVIDGDTTKLGAALKDATDKSVSCSRELKEIDKALKLDPKSTELLAQKQQVLAEAIGATESKLETMRLAQKQLQEQAARGEIGQDQYRAFGRELLQTENHLKSLKEQSSQTERELQGSSKSAAKAGSEIQKAGKKSKDAAADTDKLTDRVKDLTQAYKDAKDEAKEAGDQIKESAGDMAKIGAALIAGGTAAAVAAMGYEDSMASVQAKTGADEATMRSYGRLLDSTYAEGYGEDLNDIAATMAQIVNTTGEKNDLALKKSVESALLLRDVYGFDVAEQLRTVTMLEKQFGLSGQEAYSLIVQGAQNGLNKNGDLLDVLNEYSVHYAQLGYSAEDMFGSLINGAKSGAFSVDKIGDAVKELGIRIKDSSSTSVEAFLALGYAAEDSEEYASGAYKSLEELQASFAAGGQSAQASLQELLGELGALDDEVEINQIGVSLFGSAWEDLGKNTIIALTDTQTELVRTKDAMEKVRDIKMDTSTVKWEKLGRSVQTKVVVPLGERLLPLAEKFLTYTSKNLDRLIPTIKAVGAAVVAAMAIKKAADMASAVNKLVKAYKALKTAAEAAQAAEKKSWWGIVLAALAAVAAAVWSGIDDAKESKKAQAELEQSYRDAAQAAWDSAQVQRDAAKAIDEEFDAYENLWDELQTLVDENGKVKDGYEDRVDYIREELLEATGEEIEMVDGVISKYAELCDTMDTLLLKKRAQRMLESNSMSYDEAVAAVDSTEMEDGKYVLGSQAAYEEALAGSVAAQKAYDDEVQRQSELEYRQDVGIGLEKAELTKQLAAGEIDIGTYNGKISALDGELKKINYERENLFAINLASLQENIDDANYLRDETRKAYDRNMGVIANQEALEKAVVTGDAGLISVAMDNSRAALLTADNAAVVSLQNQQALAREEYERKRSNYAHEGSTVTAEDVAEEFTVYMRSMSETYRGMLKKDSDVAREEITAHVLAMRNALRETGAFSEAEITEILSLTRAGAKPLGELYGADFTEGVRKALPGVTAEVTEVLQKASSAISSAIGSMVSSAAAAAAKNRSNRMHTAYASGTDYAKQGYALVGEEGPELVYFRGGEAVLTAKETEAMLSVRNHRAASAALVTSRLVASLQGIPTVQALSFAAQNADFSRTGRFDGHEHQLAMGELSDRLDKILDAIENLELQPVLPIDDFIRKSTQKTDRALGDIIARRERGQLI